jgi:hypothetical protein
MERLTYLWIFVILSSCFVWCHIVGCIVDCVPTSSVNSMENGLSGETNSRLRGEEIHSSSGAWKIITYLHVHGSMHHQS